MRKFFRSFAYGFAGFWHALRTEQNLRVHVAIGVVVIAAGIFFNLVLWEWLAILLCIGLVIAAECFNTALEELADRVTREEDPLIKHAKDCGSAAVLVLAITSVVVGVLVFWPKLMEWMSTF